MMSSRIVVKNLPKTTTAEKVKQLFQSRGAVVTDVQLKYTETGKFRQFGFVGFKSEAAAKAAQEYFNGTYFGSSKIIVEDYKLIREVDQLKVWSKHSKQKSKLSDKKESKSEPPPAKKPRKEDEIIKKCQEDPAFLEFLQVQKKNKTKWGNDAIFEEISKLESSKLKSEDTNSKSDGESSSSEEDEEKDSAVKTDNPEGESPDIKKKKLPDVEFFTLKIRNMPKRTKKRDIKAFFAPLKPKSIRMPPNYRGFAYVGFVSEADRRKALLKNKSVLLGQQVFVYPYVSTRKQEELLKEKILEWEERKKSLENESESVEESGRIFIRNLPYSTNEDEIKQLFERFGPVTEVHLPLDRLTREIKGFGFVTFLLPEHAAKAYTELSGTDFQGRLLHLLPCKTKDEFSADDLQAGSSFKKEKQLKLKKTAGASHNWNSLFIGLNAVSQVAAEKYGVSREMLLLDRGDEKSSEASSAAVRMALAETEIVAETKEFMEKHGVNLDAFDLKKRPERSKTVILVKNLLPNTKASELSELFARHGVVRKVVLPPSGITAIVVFEEPAEARAAFKKLAYTNHNGMPLYLEWAPVGVIADANESESSEKSINKSSDGDDKKIVEDSSKLENIDASAQTRNIQGVNKEEEEPLEEFTVPEPETTIFVKNLNFNTKEEALKKYFSKCGPVYAAIVARKNDPKNPGNMLSMGYGFVQFYREKDAKKALETFNETMLENHILELKRSNRTLVSEDVKKEDKNKKGTKLLVRNIPFQASQSEITDLFKTFGRLKAVRLPLKAASGGEHRGFAFVEFGSEKEAQRAMETLGKSTHLYGRRLVIEWAAKEESVEDLRQKTAKQYHLHVSAQKDEENKGSTKKKMMRYFEK